MSLIDFVLKTFIREATGVADVEPEDRQQEIGSLGNLAEDVQDDDLALPDEDDEFMSGQEDECLSEISSADGAFVTMMTDKEIIAQNEKQARYKDQYHKAKQIVANKEADCKDILRQEKLKREAQNLASRTALIQTQEVCGRQIEKERKEKEEAKKYAEGCEEEILSLRAQLTKAQEQAGQKRPRPETEPTPKVHAAKSRRIARKPSTTADVKKEVQETPTLKSKKESKIAVAKSNARTKDKPSAPREVSCVKPEVKPEDEFCSPEGSSGENSTSNSARVVTKSVERKIAEAKKSGSKRAAYTLLKKEPLPSLNRYDILLEAALKKGKDNESNGYYDDIRKYMKEVVRCQGMVASNFNKSAKYGTHFGTCRCCPDCPYRIRVTLSFDGDHSCYSEVAYTGQHRQPNTPPKAEINRKVQSEKVNRNMKLFYSDDEEQQSPAKVKPEVIEIQ